MTGTVGGRLPARRWTRRPRRPAGAEDAAPGERRFAHGLVRDAIVAGLGARQRVTLHRRAAEAIEAHAGAPEAGGLRPGAPLGGGGGGRRPGRRGDVDRAGRPRGDAAARLRGRPRWYGQALELGEGVLDDVARCRLLTRVRRRPVPVLGLHRRAADLRRRGRPGRAHRPSRPGGRGCAGARADLRRGDRPGDPGAVRTRPRRPRRRAGRAPGPGAGPVRRGSATTSPTSTRPTPLSRRRSSWPRPAATRPRSRRPSPRTTWCAPARTGSPSVRTTRTGCGRSGSAPAGRLPACRRPSGASTPRASGATWRGRLASSRPSAAGPPWSAGRWRSGGCCAAGRCSLRPGGATPTRTGWAPRPSATLAATGFPPAFLLWGGLLGIQCHHTGQTPESLADVGITDADATEQDWPLPGVIPTLAPATHAGRCRSAAGGRRRLPPARPGLGVAGVAARHALHLGDRHRDRRGGRRGRRRRDPAGQARRLARAPRRERPLRHGVRAAPPSSIWAGRPHTSGSSTTRSPISSRR